MKAIKKASTKEAELPSIGLQTSLILSCFVFTLSYGAGSYSITDSKCSINTTKFTQEWGLLPMLCQASYKIPRRHYMIFSNRRLDSAGCVPNTTIGAPT